jgi:hypothetical protein
VTVTQAIAERSRQEVAFWKNQLDHAVEEKNALLDRYTALYRHAFELEQYAVQLGSENHELQHVLEQTLSDERRVQVSAAGLRCSFSGLPSSSSPVPPGGNATLVSAVPCCACCADSVRGAVGLWNACCTSALVDGAGVAGAVLARH